MAEALSVTTPLERLGDGIGVALDHGRRREALAQEVAELRAVFEQDEAGLGDAAAQQRFGYGACPGADLDHRSLAFGIDLARHGAREIAARRRHRAELQGLLGPALEELRRIAEAFRSSVAPPCAPRLCFIAASRSWTLNERYGQIVAPSRQSPARESGGRSRHPHIPPQPWRPSRPPPARPRRRAGRGRGGTRPTPPCRAPEARRRRGARRRPRQARARPNCRSRQNVANEAVAPDPLDRAFREQRAKAGIVELCEVGEARHRPGPGAP